MVEVRNKAKEEEKDVEKEEMVATGSKEVRLRGALGQRSCTWVCVVTEEHPLRAGTAATVFAPTPVRPHAGEDLHGEGNEIDAVVQMLVVGLKHL